LKKETNTLLLSRINAPEPPSHLYSRARLLNLINENYKKKLILITSPAGYGKTTLVIDYLRTASIEYAWINISEDINHAYSFFYTIVSALKKINHGFGEDTINLLNSHLEKNKFNTNAKDAISDIILTLSSECKGFFINKIALVFDDYHHIEGIEHRDFLVDSLLKELPASMQLIITSRQLPEFDFMHYIENDMMFKIEMEDLVFNNTETHELLASKYKISNPGKIAEITGKLGGWITGLHMITQGYGEELDSAEIEKQPIPENIFNFLAEKTFNRFDNETKELLLVTSVIDNFHEELCACLGINNFKQIMEKLLKDNTFIQTIPIDYSGGSTIISYNYMILFRNYIQAKLFTSKSREEIREIFRKTYNFYNENGDIITSINYLIKAEDFEIAAEEINKNFKEMFSEGKLEFLWQWLNAIPLKYINNNISSLINLGILKKYYAGDLNESMKYLDKALKMAAETREYEQLVRASINRAIIMQNLGSTASVISELRALTADEALLKYKNSLTYYLAYALFHSSEYREAEELLGEIENIENGSTEMSLPYSSRKLLGHINLIRGNYLKAVEFYEKAVNDEKNVIDRFEVLCNLTLLSSQSAEYGKAEKYLSELDDIITRFPTAVLKIPYLLAKQAYLFESGNYDSALNVMKNIYDESVLLNHKQYMYLSSRLITECLYYKNDYEQAKKYFEISKQFLDVNNKLKINELEVFRALLFNLPAEEKENIFIEAHNYYDANSLLYNLALICYYLADFYYKRGLYDNVKTYLKSSLEIASSNGYNSFLIREYKKDSSLLKSAVNSPQTDYDKNYLLKIKQKAS
jgi:ATP/maltotriose-dependent transcriptional regulator MalT